MSLVSSPYSVFSYFATGLAAGVAFHLPLIPLVQIGRRFFVLMSLISVVLVALAMAVSRLELNYLHVAFAGLLILYNVLLPAQRGVDLSARREAVRGSPRKLFSLLAQGFLFAAILCGASAIVLDALNFPSSPPRAGELLLSLAFLSSALLLGGALLALVLGHWYLVVRKLSFAPLGRVTLALMGALLLRLGSAAASIVAQREYWEAALEPSGWSGFFLDQGVFLLGRTVFGFLAPAALTWMTWKCVQIRSNQSATGILYVNLAFVLIGEIIAKYFLVSRHLVI